MKEEYFLLVQEEDFLLVQSWAGAGVGGCRFGGGDPSPPPPPLPDTPGEGFREGESDIKERFLERSLESLPRRNDFGKTP